MIVALHDELRVVVLTSKRGDAVRQFARRVVSVQLSALATVRAVDHLRARVVAVGTAAGSVDADDVIPLRLRRIPDLQPTGLARFDRRSELRHPALDGFDIEHALTR